MNCIKIRTAVQSSRARQEMKHHTEARKSYMEISYFFKFYKSYKKIIKLESQKYVLQTLYIGCFDTVYFFNIDY